MSLLQKGSKENWEVIGVQGVGCCCVFRVEISGVPSMFWVVFVDGSGVFGCVWGRGYSTNRGVCLYWG